jgi:hypothetical protein
MSRDRLRRFASAGFLGIRLGALTVTAEEAVAAARAFGAETAKLPKTASHITAAIPIIIMPLRFIAASPVQVLRTDTSSMGEVRFARFCSDALRVDPSSRPLWVSS